MAHATSVSRLRDVFLDQFIASFDTPPRHLTFDLDAVDDPAHGHQQLTFWHGYYDQNTSVRTSLSREMIARRQSFDPPDPRGVIPDVVARNHPMAMISIGRLTMPWVKGVPHGGGR